MEEIPPRQRSLKEAGLCKHCVSMCVCVQIFQTLLDTFPLPVALKSGHYHLTNLTLKLYDEMCYINKFLACLHQRKILCIFKGLYHSCEEGNSIMLPHWGHTGKHSNPTGSSDPFHSERRPRYLLYLCVSCKVCIRMTSCFNLHLESFVVVWLLYWRTGHAHFQFYLEIILMVIWLVSACLVVFNYMHRT